MKIIHFLLSAIGFVPYFITRIISAAIYASKAQFSCPTCHQAKQEQGDK